jgi:hypothetical protein
LLRLEGRGTPGEAALAGTILAGLCLGDELEAFAALVPFERNRQGFGELLAAMRAQAAALALGGGEQPERDAQIRARVTRRQLLAIVAVLDDIAQGLAGNVSGLLLCTALCSKIRLALESV